jgi:hypothetical protein
MGACSDDLTCSRRLISLSTSPHATTCVLTCVLILLYVWEFVSGCLFGRFDLFATPDLARVALNRGPQPLLQFANLR